MIVPMVPLMSLTLVQRELLLNGPSGWGKKHDVVKAFGGPCQIITAWRKHRAELMAACPMGKRPYAFWMVERRLTQRLAGERAELKMLLELDLCRDSAERAHCEQRLGENRAAHTRPPGAPGLQSEKIADGIADGTTLGFAWVRARNA